MRTKPSVTIAEDHELVRKALISLLNQSRDIEVLDEACNGKDLLHKLKIKLPDIVLMDYRMPVMDGREALQLIKTKYPNQKVIMMSVHDDNDLIMDFIAKGANGFISKASSAETLYKAITRTHFDGHYMDAKISELVINGFSNKKRELNKKENLSEREISVLREICNGSTNKGISERLYISTSTVDFHKGNIYKKTNCKNVVDLVKYAFKNGIIHV